MLGQVGKGQRLTRRDEARIHLRDSSGNHLDRAVHDASLRFSRGLGAKSRCKVKNMQPRRAPCTIAIETHWLKGKVRHPVRHHKLCLGHLGRKSNPLPRLTNGRADARRRKRFSFFCTRQLKSRRRQSRIQSHQLRAAPCPAGRCQDLG
jgi:hypothetical protein